MSSKLFIVVLETAARIAEILKSLSSQPATASLHSILTGSKNRSSQV